jgi:hypothetical protein
MFDYQHIPTTIKVTEKYYNSLPISERVNYKRIEKEEDRFVFPNDLDSILPNIGNDDTKDDFSGFGNGGDGFDGGGSSSDF